MPSRLPSAPPTRSDSISPGISAQSVTFNPVLAYSVLCVQPLRLPLQDVYKIGGIGTVRAFLVPAAAVACSHLVLRQFCNLCELGC